MNVFSLFGEITLRGIDGVNQKLKGLEGKLDSAGRKMESTGKKLTMFVTAPLLAAGGAAFKMAGDFDDAFRQVNVMLGASAEEAVEYKKRILEISTATGQAAVDVADAYKQIVSAGFRGADSLDILTIAMEGATAGSADAVSTTEALTKTMNIFEAEGVEGASKAMDVFFGIVDSGLLTFEQLARSFPRAASNAAGLKISVEETGATLATLTKVLGTTEQAATATDAIFRTLISPSKAMIDLYDKWGVKSGPEAIKKFGSLSAVIDKLKDSTGGEVTAIRELFNSDEAMKGILPILTSSYDDFNDAVVTVTDSTGKYKDALDGVIEGPGFQWNQMVNEMQNNTIALGDHVARVFGPIMNKVIEKVTAVVDKFTELTEEQQNNILRWIGIAAVAGPALIIIGKMTIGIATLATLTRTTLIPAIVKATAAIWAKVTALYAALAAMGPTGWAQIAVAMATTAGIVTLFIKNTRLETDEFTQATKDSTKAMRSADDVAKDYTETMATLENVQRRITEQTDELAAVNAKIADSNNGITARVQVIIRQGSDLLDVLRREAEATDILSQASQDYVTLLLQREELSDSAISYLRQYAKALEDAKEADEALAAAQRAEAATLAAEQSKLASAARARDDATAKVKSWLDQYKLSISVLGEHSLQMADVYQWLIAQQAPLEIIQDAYLKYGENLENVDGLLEYVRDHGYEVSDMWDETTGAITRQYDAYDELLAQILYENSELGKLGYTMADIYEALIKEGKAADLVAESMDAFGSEIVNLDDLLAHLETNGIGTVELFKLLKKYADDAGVAIKGLTESGGGLGGPGQTETGIPASQLSALGVSGGTADDLLNWMGTFKSMMPELGSEMTTELQAYMDAQAAKRQPSAPSSFVVSWLKSNWSRIWEASGLQGFADGGMINEPTYLTRVGDAKPYGIMAERGPEPIGWGGVMVTGNTFNVRQESDINAIADQIVTKIRQKTGAQM